MKIIKLCIFLFALSSMSLINAQFNVRFDNQCLFENSIEFGRAIMQTIGEKEVRRMIERDVNIKVVLEIDSAGKVTRILRSDFKYITKKDSLRLLSNIYLKRHFYICFIDGKENKTKIIQEIRNDYRRHQKLSIAIFFPGQLLWEYSVNNKIRVNKIDYIIGELKRQTRY